jgi:hypothetical protein
MPNKPKLQASLLLTSFGEHYFEMAVTLRESMLVNGILTNCDVWYWLTDTDVGHLEEVDSLGSTINMPYRSLLARNGLPTNFVIKKSRRLN